MTRYEELMQSEDAEILLKKYNIDKEGLDAESANFKAFGDIDIGDQHVISYYFPTILPISYILWCKPFEVFNRKSLFAYCKDGYGKILVIGDTEYDTVVKMLYSRNKKMVYGINEKLDELFEENFDKFCELIYAHPNEDAESIIVDSSLLSTVEETTAINKSDANSEKAEAQESTYKPPEKIDLKQAVVPEDEPFAEEMELLKYLSEKYPEEVELTLYKPVSELDFDDFERRNKIKLSDELKAFYMFSDGLSLSAAHIAIDSLRDVEKNLNNEYEWGDTKNYVLLGDMIGDGEAIFYNLDSQKIITNDHGEEAEFDDFASLLGYVIMDFIQGEIEDEKLEEYCSGYEGIEDEDFE